jgi:hypothetical protein
MLGSRCPANRTSAIPLRNPTTGRRAQDDDAKHEFVSWNFGSLDEIGSL